MKIAKYSLLTILIISGLFQLVIGAWMLLDIQSGAQILMALPANADVISTFEFTVLAKMAAKAFFMLAIYSAITCYFIAKDKTAAFLMSIATGIMIALISITTFIDTASYMVWITDFSRGALIIILSLIYNRALAKKELK